jgi:hypothetical protein
MVRVSSRQGKRLKKAPGHRIVVVRTLGVGIVAVRFRLARPTKKLSETFLNLKNKKLVLNTSSLLGPASIIPVVYQVGGLNSDLRRSTVALP